MVDCRKLKAKIVEKGLTSKEVAHRMGISDKTLYRKLESGIFTSIEMNKLVDILQIEDPQNVFFAKPVN